MENKDLELDEMRRQMRQLHTDISQHSTFHADVWHRSIERHTRRLNRIALWSIIAGCLMFPTISLLLWLTDTTPWWVALCSFVALSAMLVDAIIQLRRQWHVDAYSREGLMSLKKSMEENKRGALRRKRIYFIVGTTLLVLLFWQVYLDEGISGLVGQLISLAITMLIVDLLVLRPLQKSNRRLKGEVGTLLDEEEA